MSNGIERRRGFSLAEQLRVLVPLFVVWAIGFAVLAIVATHSNLGEFFLDPSYQSGGTWYIGVVSQLGVLAWTIAMMCAAASAWVAAEAGRRGASRFMRAAAYASGVLMLDDLFELHAVLSGSLGVPKVALEGLVVLPTVLWVMEFRRDIGRTRWQVLVAAIGANAMSVAVDTLAHPSSFDRALLLEDGAKFLGTLAWATYFVVTARDISRSAMRTRSLLGVVDETERFRRALVDLDHETDSARTADREWNARVLPGDRIHDDAIGIVSHLDDAALQRRHPIRIRKVADR